MTFLRHDDAVDPASRRGIGTLSVDGSFISPISTGVPEALSASGEAQRNGWVATMSHRLPVGRLNTKVSANGDATLLNWSPLAS